MKPLSTGTFQIITIQLINECIKNVMPLKETAFFFNGLQAHSCICPLQWLKCVVCVNSTSGVGFLEASLEKAAQSLIRQGASLRLKNEYLTSKVPSNLKFLSDLTF